MKNKGKIFGFTIFALLLTIVSTLGGIVNPVNAQEASQTNLLNDITIQMKVYDRDNRDITSTSSSTYIDDENDRSKDLSYTAYSWDLAQRVDITGVRGPSIISQIPNSDSYNISLNVEYADLYRDGTGFSARKETIYNVLTQTGVKDIQDLGDKSLTFYFDPSTNNNESQKNHGKGWGIYRFSLIITPINEEGNPIGGGLPYECTSNLIIIEPTVPASSQADMPVYLENKENISAFTTAVITKDEVSSTTMQWAYEFTISNDIKYTYCDQSLIKWYVTGTGTDGKPYVLTEADRALPEFAGYRDSIYKGEVDRNGLTFIFDSYGIGGEWKVYCEITNRATGQTYRSEEITVTTATKMNANTIYFIIGGCAAAVLIVVIVVIIVAKKKEKVW